MPADTAVRASPLPDRVDYQRANNMKKGLLQAAERGVAEAQFNLGMMYGNGSNDSRYAVAGDRLEAIRWLTAAAEQGLSRAQIKLAELYAEDSETPESSVKACGWLLLATAGLRGAQQQEARSAYQRASTGRGSYADGMDRSIARSVAFDSLIASVLQSRGRVGWGRPNEDHPFTR